MSHAKKSSNPDEFILPDLGEGVVEAELIKWRVKPGDRVREHDVLADMETDKALVEVPSPRDGVIAQINGAEGEIIKVGAVLVTYAGGAGAAQSTQAKHAEAAPNCDMGSQIASHTPTSNGSAAHAEVREDAGTVVGAVGGALAGMSAAPGKALATPAVRRLARDLGVDIDSISGSGIGGRVQDRDVRAAAEGSSRANGSATPSAPASRSAHGAPPPAARPAAPITTTAPTRTTPAPSAKPPAPAPAPRTPATAASFPAGTETQRVPFRGVRRTIAARLRESIDSAVHFTVMDEADVSALDAFRRKLAAASGEKLSLLPFVAAAMCRALIGEFSALNATADLRADADGNLEGDIVRHRAVHLGVATDTDSGLMVPVVRDCDALGVLEIARGIAHVAESARNRSAPREMLSGSTFTISNVGSHAGRFATPVINAPEVAILAVGRMREGVVARNGAIAVAKVLPLSLACDHRIVDGASAALCLAKLVAMLQDDPEALLAPARG
jgi:pyruvate dehydrogenase E2 component (dihydrolipoamide acetyltransferase)